MRRAPRRGLDHALLAAADLQIIQAVPCIRIPGFGFQDAIVEMPGIIRSFQGSPVGSPRTMVSLNFSQSVTGASGHASIAQYWNRRRRRGFCGARETVPWASTVSSRTTGRN